MKGIGVTSERARELREGPVRRESVLPNICSGEDGAVVCCASLW